MIFIRLLSVNKTNCDYLCQEFSYEMLNWHHLCAFSTSGNSIRLRRNFAQSQIWKKRRILAGTGLRCNPTYKASWRYQTVQRFATMSLCHLGSYKARIMFSSVVTILLFLVSIDFDSIFAKIVISLLMSIFSWRTFINFWSLHNTTILEALNLFVNNNCSCDNVGK